MAALGGQHTTHPGSITLRRMPRPGRTRLSHLRPDLLVDTAPEHHMLRQRYRPEVGEEELGAQPRAQRLQAAHCGTGGQWCEHRHLSGSICKGPAAAAARPKSAQAAHVPSLRPLVHSLVADIPMI